LLTFFSLNSVLNHDNSRLWTLMPLFIAPFTSVALALAATRLFPATGYFLYALPVCFAMPFFLVVRLVRFKNHRSR
jgi:hypothetical protein